MFAVYLFSKSSIRVIDNQIIYKLNKGIYEKVFFNARMCIDTI